MFQYEYEKRPPSSSSCVSQTTTLTSWDPPTATSRPPLPPRPQQYQRIPSKTTVPLKVWIIASASCFAVCAALVLATVVITKWGSPNEYTRQILEDQDPVYSNPHPIYFTHKPDHVEDDTTTSSNEIDTDMEIIEKLSIFKNVVAQRANTKKDLVSKPQIHPLHDTTIEHAKRKIEKKDQAKYPEHLPKLNADNTKRPIPAFKPTLPDVFIQGEVKLPDGYFLGLRKPSQDYEEYYSDDNLYEDYMQSNTMTNYLIEKVQELHDWINSDPDFETVKNTSRIARNSSDFTEILKALNQSLVQGDVTIVMSKLRDLYLGDVNATTSHPRKMIASNSTDLLSFGILTLDIMLLHNIQLMAWENQESARAKMLKDPDVFAFNALFMDPSKVAASQNVVSRQGVPALTSKRQNLRQGTEESDLGSSLLDNFLEIGVSTTRAAINLGRAYKNTKAILNQLSNRDSPPSNVHSQLSRNIDGSAVALNHLQSSFGGGVVNGTYYTELDCLWLLYCRNLVATTKLDAPYGTMARINSVALRLVAGEMPADSALHVALLDALGGWTDLRCDQMFPRCSKVNASSVVLNTILQPSNKS
ncbi:unnamed protein product [Chilo suppressalis]|uniref:FHA domain-containing protein n=1 Tax=Chilo suppressalis TaxID=168631 RepID=A0ABN8LA74_CHISP|nr:unnamed protein product [Chilo suppressalis]